MYKSSTIFGSKFLVLKSRLIHRKIRYIFVAVPTHGILFLFLKNYTSSITQCHSCIRVISESPSDLPRLAKLFADQSYKTNVNLTCIIEMIDYSWFYVLVCKCTC